MTDIPRILGGRYELGNLIGRGGMAQVHVGYDTRLSRSVAIKVLRSDLASDPTFLARFRREAQSAAALNHPSIVAVYDTGEESTTSPVTGKPIPLPYIVMEYVKGETVSKLLSNGDALPIDEAVQIVVGVLSALEYSHREGIVHRDIKPGNIMITPEGKVKVMDFGIARAIADSAATMTQTNSVVGTAQYLSPEQARGEVVDARSDLYSTGCLFYELLTGKPPFQGDSAVAVAYQHVSEPAKPAREVAPDIPDEIDRVVMKSLAKRREDRYQNAGEMRADLLRASRGEGVSAPAVTAWQTDVIPTPRAGIAAASGAAAGAAHGVFAPGYASADSINPPSTSTPDGAGYVRTPDTATSITPAQQEPKKRNGLYIALGVLLLALAAAGLGWALMNGGSEPGDAETTISQVAVPDLQGMNQAGARAALESVGLTMVVGDPVEDAETESGLFVSSNPATGTTVDVGSRVTVHFSSGVGMTQVPDLTNGTYTQDTARDALEAVGLAVGRIDEVDTPGRAKDVVTKTNPSANTEVEKGTDVDLTVASGEVKLPNLIGLTEANALAELEALQLTAANPTFIQNDAFEPGTVVEVQLSSGESLTGGQQVPFDAQVTLVLAEATPEPTEEPTEDPTPDPTPTEDPTVDPTQDPTTGPTVDPSNGTDPNAPQDPTASPSA